MKRLFLKCPILKTVGVTAILAGACTYAPTDGERSASADGSFSIRGFATGTCSSIRRERATRRCSATASESAAATRCCTALRKAG